MDYSMVRKLEKAQQYAKDRDRFKFETFEIIMGGSNNSHKITYDHGKWHCDCEFFSGRGRCSHTMALEIILTEMVEIAYED